MSLNSESGAMPKLRFLCQGYVAIFISFLILENSVESTHPDSDKLLDQRFSSSFSDGEYSRTFSPHAKIQKSIGNEKDILRESRRSHGRHSSEPLMLEGKEHDVGDCIIGQSEIQLGPCSNRKRAAKFLLERKGKRKAILTSAHLQEDHWNSRFEGLLAKHSQTRKLAEGNSTDAAALLSIKSALQDPGNFLSSWNPSVNPNICLGWHGVSCSASGQVTVLNLTAVNASQTLAGSLSASIGQLAHLTFLLVANHDLSGPLPVELGLLPSLHSLNLSSNAFTAPLPAFRNPSLQSLDLSSNGIQISFASVAGQLAGASSSLRLLDLSENLITGGITDEIFSFSSLEHLDLSLNTLEGPLTEAVGGLGRLHTLNLGFNRLSGTIPSSLGLLSNLSTLVLDLNNFTGSIPVALKNCSSLSFISLNNNTLSGTVPDEILESLSQTLTYFSVQANLLEGPVSPSFINCSLLETLDLSLNSFTGSIPTLCRGIQSRLNTLVVDYNSLSGDLPLHLATCRNLQHLALSSNRFGGVFPASYASELPLEEFSAANNNINGPFPSNLTGWIRGRLKILFLEGNNISGQIPEAIGQLSSLQHLLLSANALSGPIPPSIVNCSSLITLSLYNNSLTGGLPPGLRRLRSLASLYLQLNRLSGELPPELGDVAKLRNFNITKNALSGPIPASLGSLTHLRFINLAFNNLSGPVPGTLGGLGSLFALRLNDNALSGTVPSTLLNLTSLETLSLHNNNLSGEFPWEFIRASEVLTRLDLANNSFSGEIPDRHWGDVAGTFVRMRLQGNRFSGRIPDGMAAVASLQILDLSRNELSGHIPPGFASLAALTSFNVSYNRLSGEVPGGALLRFPASSFLGNAGLCGPQLGVGCGEAGGRFLEPGPLAAVVTGSAVLLAAVVAAAAWLCCRRSSRGKGRERVFCFKDVGVELSVGRVLAATENFSERCKIGEGGQGSVFRATLENGKLLAVKRYKKTPKIHKAMSSEVHTLGQVRHRNVATLVACIVADDELLILYEYVAGGDLSKLLSSGRAGRAALPTWEQSLHLILGSAQGLEYLHHGCPVPIIHRDIKPANILLGDNSTPQIGDFGLSRFVNDSKPHVSTAAAGTVGYLAPECSETGKVTTASDVFSFGVVMLGIVTGKGPKSVVSEEVQYVAWVAESGFRAAVDSRGGVVSAAEEEQIKTTIELGLKCCAVDPVERPSMETVVKAMQAIITSGLPERTESRGVDDV